MVPAAQLSPARQRLLLAAVLSGLLLAMLDQTIVGTALPRIAAELDGESGYVWVVTAYLVTATVSLPVYARLSDRHGRRALLLIGMGLFLAGSALAGSAQDMEQLIAWRAVQGLGAGALEGLSFILVADLYAGRRAAALQGLLAGLMGVSFIAGPLLGGVLADEAGWRSVFYVNLPIGAAALAIVAAVLPRSLGRSEGRGTPLDLAGIALLTASVGLLLVGLSERSHVGAEGALPGWAEWRTGGLLVAAAILLAAFVAVERRAPAPIVPLRLLTQRRTAAILLAAGFGAFALFASVLLLPRYFQLARDASATESGLLVYPLLLGLVVSVNVAGALIARRLEFRRVVLGGQALAALGAAGFLAFDAGTPDWVSLLLMAALGLGVGPALSGLQIAMQRSVAPQAIGGALGTLLLLRQVGAVVAMAAAESVHAGRLADGASAAEATGAGVALVALAGGALAAAALVVVLPRGAGRLPAPPGPPARRAAPDRAEGESAPGRSAEADAAPAPVASGA